MIAALCTLLMRPSTERPHAALGRGIPNATTGPLTPTGHHLTLGQRVIARPRLGGLHHDYRLVTRRLSFCGARASETRPDRWDGDHRLPGRRGIRCQTASGRTTPDQSMTRTDTLRGRRRLCSRAATRQQQRRGIAFGRPRGGSGAPHSPIRVECRAGHALLRRASPPSLSCPYQKVRSCCAS